jgi:hypothetical protein
MAGFILVSDVYKWSSANWVYWGVIDYLIEALKDNPDVAGYIEMCKAMQIIDFVSFREEHPDWAEKAFIMLKNVSQKCANGSLPCRVEGRVLGDHSQSQFREAMEELVNLLSPK